MSDAKQQTETDEVETAEVEQTATSAKGKKRGKRPRDVVRTAKEKKRGKRTRRTS